MFYYWFPSSPEVIDALSNQLMNSVCVIPADQFLNQPQLLLQLFCTWILQSRCDSTVQDLLSSVLDVFQVTFNLAQCIIPKLEANMTANTAWKDAREPSGTLIAMSPCSSLHTYAVTCCSVTLGNFWAQGVTFTFWKRRRKERRCGGPFLVMEKITQTNQYKASWYKKEILLKGYTYRDLWMEARELLDTLLFWIRKKKPANKCCFFWSYQSSSSRQKHVATLQMLW